MTKHNNALISSFFLMREEDQSLLVVFFISNFEGDVEANSDDLDQTPHFLASRL